MGFGGANQEQEQTLNQILTEMDGFDGRQAVIVIAATNRPDVLDPALLRPGRFDRRVTVLPPDRVGREAILNVHTRGVPLARDINLGAIASATPGLVGADLRNLVNEAALTAAHRNRDAVTKADFFEALEKITLGAARKLVMSVDDRKRVAYHEAGHALMGLLLPDVDPVQKVTIVPRGQALGVTYQVPLDDRLSYGESYLRGRIAGALGGRAAESLVFGSVSTGAENDLQQATRIARQMVTRWGMSDKVGLVYVAREDGGFLGGDSMMPDLGSGLSDRLGALVDAETKRIVSECYVVTEENLARERSRLEALAEALLERESLDEDEIWRVTGITKPSRGVPALEGASGIASGGAPGGAPGSAPGGDGEDTKDTKDGRLPGTLPGEPEAPAGPGAPALTPAVA
jgi:cell division protease FtsH